MDSKAPPAFRDVCTINQPLDPLFPPHSYFIRYFLFARSPTISLPHLHHLHHARTILCALPPSPPRLLFSVYPPSFSTFWSLFPPFPSRHALPHHSIFSVLLLCSSGMRVASSPHKRYFDSFIDRVSTRFALYLYYTRSNCKPPSQLTGRVYSLLQLLPLLLPARALQPHWQD